MATELQFLLDKIQSEGIEKANAEATRIINDATGRAKAIVAEAQATAAEFRSKSEADAELFRQRAEQAVRQAARDVLLEVQRNMDQSLQRLFLAKVSEAMSPEFLKAVLANLIKEGLGNVEFKLSPSDMAALSQSLVKEIQQRAGQSQGVRIAPDSDIRAGFRVFVSDGRVEHDFTAQAIQEALGRLLRPALAALIAQDPTAVECGRTPSNAVEH